MKYWIQCFFSNLRNNSWFILFKWNSIWFEKYKWNINRHCIWLLICCKNKNSYDMKMYFHSIKIILYLIKHIFVISLFFHDIKIYFHSIKTNLNSIKYIFNMSPFSPMISKYIFRSVKINFYSVINIFIIYIFFIQVKYILIILIFHWMLFCWAYLVFHLYLQKSEFYFQCVNWTTARVCEY